MINKLIYAFATAFVLAISTLSCVTTRDEKDEQEAIELRDKELFFVKAFTVKRLKGDNKYIEVPVFLYRDAEGIPFKKDRYLGERVIIQLPTRFR